VLKTHLAHAVVPFGAAQDRLSPHHERNLKPAPPEALEGTVVIVFNTC
jgi:hypothetical protein